MLFLWKDQNVRLPEINPRNELHYNYIILSEISQKDLGNILWSVLRVHSHKYSESIAEYFRNNSINDELLKNLNVDKELIENYKSLKKLSKIYGKDKNFEKIILAMVIVHSNDYITNLCEVAKRDNNYQLVAIILEQQRVENQKLKEEIKSNIKNRYNELVNSLYWWLYKWSVYELDKEILALQCKLELIFWYNNDIIKSCDAIVKDICDRWQEMINQISDAIKNNTQWWYFDNNKLLHIDI